MHKLWIVLLVACMVCIGCPSTHTPLPTPDPIVDTEPDTDDDVTDDVEDWDLDPYPDPNYLPQQCKLEWYGVNFDNYEALIKHIKKELLLSTCTSDSILCIYVGIEGNCFKIWEFPTMDSIPRHTITDECGNNVIYYREDNL